MKMRYIMGCFMALLFSVPAVAQQYTGMSGLIHVPSADMGEEGEARVGGAFPEPGVYPERADVWRG